MHGLAEVIHLVITVLVILVVARVLLSWFPGIHWRFPAVRLLYRIVDPLLRPFRRVLPTFAGIDVSPLLLIVLLQVGDRAVTGYLDGVYTDPAQVLVYVVEQVLLAIAIVLTIIVFLRLIVSLFQADPFHPGVRLIREMSRPLTEPFSGVLPRSRSFDSAALVAFVAYLLAYVLIGVVFDRLVAHV